jgi:hypothetical protein
MYQRPYEAGIPVAVAAGNDTGRTRGSSATPAQQLYLRDQTEAIKHGLALWETQWGQLDGKNINSQVPRESELNDSTARLISHLQQNVHVLRKGGEDEFE